MFGCLLMLLLGFQPSGSPQNEPAPIVKPDRETLNREAKQAVDHFFDLLLRERNARRALTCFHNRAFRNKYLLEGSYLGEWEVAGKFPDDKARELTLGVLHQITQIAIKEDLPKIFSTERLKDDTPTGVRLLSDIARDGYLLMEVPTNSKPDDRMDPSWVEWEYLKKNYPSKNYVAGFVFIRARFLSPDDMKEEDIELPLYFVLGKYGNTWKIIHFGMMGQ